MTARPARIMITAGEPSGDRLGAGVARALRARAPEIELFGMGGEAMAAAGVERIQDASEVAVVGVVEVLSRLGAIRRAMDRLEQALHDRRPDLLVPVDFPDFNLRLAAAARRAGVPVVYFVSPQVWAWRRSRVRKIRRLVRRMLVLFRFETDFYSAAGVPATFVGHPLALDPVSPVPADELCRRAGLDAGRRTIALMPGSRRGEIGRLLPVLLETARRLERTHPDLQFLVPLAPGVPPSAVTGPAGEAGPGRLRVHGGDYPEILSVCAAGVVAAGTASLEAAAWELPVAVVYRMHPITYWVGRLLVRLDHVALPNLVAGRRVVPELIQGECRPEAIAGVISGYLDDPAGTERLRRDLGELRRRLGEPGVFERAAEAVLAELEKGPGAGR